MIAFAEVLVPLDETSSLGQQRPSNFASPSERVEAESPRVKLDFFSSSHACRRARLCVREPALPFPVVAASTKVSHHLA